ncbi:hypothetical protein D3C80_1170250 [compost metagenome]
MAQELLVDALTGEDVIHLARGEGGQLFIEGEKGHGFGLPGADDGDVGRGVARRHPGTLQLLE